MKKYLTLDVGGSAIKYALIQEDLNHLEYLVNVHILFLH